MRAAAREYEIYDPADVRAVIAACDTDRPTGCRDAALVFFLWCTGLRCAEMCDLKPDDINRRRGTVWVACGKGGKSRTVVTPQAHRAELWRLLDAWEAHRVNYAWTNGTLFCAATGARLDESYVRKTMKRLASAAGVTRRFHPHGLRHTFAARMHLGGVPLDVIQRQLGHNDLSITGAYLRRIGVDVVHDTIANFSLED